MSVANYCVAPLTEKIQKLMIVYFVKVHAFVLFFLYFAQPSILVCLK